MNIHLIASLNSFVKLQDNTWESGDWLMDESKAQKLVGGEIYFHKKRQEASFYGGKILGYSIHQDAAERKRIVFNLEYRLSCRNISTDKTGWTKDMKIIGQEEQSPSS